jgi:hypothetical protein
MPTPKRAIGLHRTGAPGFSAVEVLVALVLVGVAFVAVLQSSSTVAKVSKNQNYQFDVNALRQFLGEHFSCEQTFGAAASWDCPGTDATVPIALKNHTGGTLVEAAAFTDYGSQTRVGDYLVAAECTRGTAGESPALRVQAQRVKVDSTSAAVDPLTGKTQTPFDPFDGIPISCTNSVASTPPTTPPNDSQCTMAISAGSGMAFSPHDYFYGPEFRKRDPTIGFAIWDINVIDRWIVKMAVFEPENSGLAAPDLTTPSSGFLSKPKDNLYFVSLADMQAPSNWSHLHFNLTFTGLDASSNPLTSYSMAVELVSPLVLVPHPVTELTP